MPDAETVKMLFNYGVPAGLLVALMAGAYRLAIIAGGFLAPLLRDLTGQHLKTMSTFEVVGKGLLEQQAAQTELMKRHDTTLVSQGAKIDDIHKAVVR